jgi:hypothetical protein
MIRNSGYDSVATSIDTEVYKLVAFEMLDEAGVFVAVNTLLTGAIRKGSRIEAAITESRSGREAVGAKAFVDCTRTATWPLRPERSTPNPTITACATAWASRMSTLRSSVSG